MHVVVDPGEGDGSILAALTEPEQERPRTLPAQQSLLPLLADEAQDTPAQRKKSFRSAEVGEVSAHDVLGAEGPHPSFQRENRWRLIRSRIPSIHSQKGNAFSLALCCSTRCESERY